MSERFKGAREFSFERCPVVRNDGSEHHEWVLLKNLEDSLEDYAWCRFCGWSSRWDKLARFWTL